MIEKIKDFNSIEDFILDEYFADIAKKNDRNKIDELVKLYPEKKDMIEEAMVLLRYLVVETPDVPDEQIEYDWSRLQDRINRTKKQKTGRRFYLWATAGIAAACAILIFFLFVVPVRNDVIESQQLLSMIEAVDDQTTDIQIISGTSQTNVDNNQTIVQTEEGDLIVGKGKKVELADAAADYLTVVVPKGKRTTLKLSDGTSIQVNSGTKVVYPRTFGKGSRKIMIDGEIFLDVAKDKSRPFIVQTKGFEVEVLGTQFNISAYSSDSEKSVVLVEGSVKVSTEASEQKLQPNQGFFAVDGDIKVKNVDVYPYTCWKDEVMQLSGESLNIIMKKLSRYYGVEIEYNNHYTREIYKGKLNLKEPLETVLYNISLSTPLSYQKDGNRYIIR